MTESDWLNGGEPRPMIDFIRQRISDRKLRWFACACARAVWPLMLDERSQFAVEVSERFADGEVLAEDLLAAEQAAFEVARPIDLRTTASDPGWAATRAAARAANLDAYSAATGAAFVSAMAVAPWSLHPDTGAIYHTDPEGKSLARRAQCDLLREVVGNPFRPVVIAPAWLGWNSSIVARLAREIYDGRRFEELPVLADALEEAGCENRDLLDHLRHPGPHVRGCWALDTILG